jgi:hypothetical protein
MPPQTLCRSWRAFWERRAEDKLGLFAAAQAISPFARRFKR